MQHDNKMDINIQNAIQLTQVKFPEFSVIDYSSIIENNLTDEVEMNLGYGIIFSETDFQHFIVEFNLELTNNDFKAVVKMIAIFKAKEPISEDFKNAPFIQINAPAIAFPYLRSFITTISTSAGFKPIILPTINLTKR